MRRQDLVCARCARPVTEGRCPACRSSRQHLHSQGHSPAALFTLLVALLMAAAAAVLVGIQGLGEQFGY